MKISGAVYSVMNLGLMNELVTMKWSIKLAILVIFVVGLLIYLYYRFVYSRRRVELPQGKNDFSHIPGPKEWEKQMIDLSYTHHNVVRKQYNFVLVDRNRLAHRKLNHIRNIISEISSEIILLIPAARWLFDNYQIMYREIKKESMWDTSYEQLPILRSKQYKGYPRVYLVAKNMVAISRGHINEDNISIMLHAYQKETPLTDEELGVLPSILGFCLLEQIIEVADAIIRIIKIKTKADRFVKEKISAHHSETDISELLCEIDSDCKENYSFHSQVIYLLRNMSFSKAAILKYTEYHYPMDSKYRQPVNIFSDEGKLESNWESTIQVLVGSLREINEIDEQQFFEELSCVESILSQDPAGVYPKMDPISRAMYRSIIIKISKKYKIKEESIAEDCLKLAQEGRDDLANSKHVGSYLLGKGYPLLKNKVKNKKQPGNLQKRWCHIIADKRKGFVYYLVIIVLFALLCLGMLLLMRNTGKVTEGYLCVIFLVIASPILLGISLMITNYFFTKVMPIRKIPSLDYQDRIPDVARTILVMPVLISSKNQCIDYMERLERHYLANRQANLYFALIVDFQDAPQQRIPQDDLLEEALIEQLQQYNQHYLSTNNRFCLFIRTRKWNEAENCYMGWERKRGKLDEFNRLLCGTKQEDTTFSTVLCEQQLLETFKYVITLDADSDLIPDNASKLVGIIDHPLNQPVIDMETGKLIEGYAIIQPTVQNHIIDQNSSRFSNIFGDESGLSHYSFVVSDVYQDVFNEGVFVGKGIYDVHAFHQLLQGMIPENRVLSHDLLESCYARTAFSSAVKILDGFPNTILSYVRREQRWIRGDWQLLPWLFKRNNVNGLSKWKIFDNLRRSLVAGSKLLFLILNLVFMPQIFYLGFILVFCSDILRLILLLGKVVIGKLRKPRLTIIHSEVWREVLRRLERAVLELVFIPYRAYIATIAIGQTLFRITISKKKLLRWKASEAVEKSVENTTRGYFLKMWGSFIPSILILILVNLVDLSMVGVIIYLVLALAWCLAYLIAYSIRLPRMERIYKQDKENRELLLETARRTWQFFKDFSFQENGWLCPDNYQEVPQKKMSNKTSPTNIGLQFLTILSARDLGLETISETVKRIANLVETVNKLPKWRGHLYNWYNIQTNEILNPAYISTVDSGNFFGHVITLNNGLMEQIDLPILSNKELEECKLVIDKLSEISGLRSEYASIGELALDLKIIEKELEARENIEVQVV